MIFIIRNCFDTNDLYEFEFKIGSKTWIQIYQNFNRNMFPLFYTLETIILWQHLIEIAIPDQLISFTPHSDSGREKIYISSFTLFTELESESKCQNRSVDNLKINHSKTNNIPIISIWVAFHLRRIVCATLVLLIFIIDIKWSYNYVLRDKNTILQS